MALAYVNGATGTATATSLTFATDCTGADILLVGFSISTGTVSSVTYNGVSMSLATSNTSNIKTYLYYLVAPSAGSNNVVITASGSATINGASVCYSGAKQTGQPEAVSSSSDILLSDISVNVTTTTDNAWVVAIGAVSLGTTLTRLSSGSTRQNANKVIMFDFGPKTPTGSVTSSFSSNNGFDTMAICVASISESTTSTGGSFLPFFI